MSGKEKEQEPRIGVFVCHCGRNIGGVVNVKEVVEYASTLPHVAHAEDNLYTCADDGLTSIKEAIKKYNLNRVIVSACTPRTHAPLFQKTIESEGLNKYLFEFVNIREQDSWVHSHDKEAATEKAKDLVRMGVAKAALLEPEEEQKICVEPTALIIGGGISGMTAALSLAGMGYRSYLVEKMDRFGGFVNNLANLYMEGGDAAKSIEPIIQRIRDNRLIHKYLNTKVVDVDGYIGNFRVTVEGPAGKDCLKVGTIIVATGAEEFEPLGYYGYDSFDNVVTLSELELMMKEKKLPPVKDVAFIQCVGSRGQELPYCSRICCNVSMKNALALAEMAEKGELGQGENITVEKTVGNESISEEIAAQRRQRRRRSSRRHEHEGGGERKAQPAGRAKVNVTIFNRTICTYGVHHEIYYNKAREKGVRFLRYTPDRPPKIRASGNRLAIDYYHKTLQAERSMEVDLVVLAAPLVQNPDAKDLSKLLKVPLGPDGWFLEAHVKLRPLDFATEGIFVCGPARGPADISESVDQALGAAARAAIPMSRGYVQAEALFPQIDADTCTGCGTCIQVCPYNALYKNEDNKAEVIVAACKGCGLCGSVCPEKAIDMTAFRDEQVMAQALAALESLETVLEEVKAYE